MGFFVKPPSGDEKTPDQKEQPLAIEPASARERIKAVRMRFGRIRESMITLIYMTYYSSRIVEEVGSIPVAGKVGWCASPGKSFPERAVDAIANVIV